MSSTCTILGCDRQAVARGLCMPHYKRHVVRGHPIPTRVEPQIGDPSGHGAYGVMERHETLALCHECGGWYQSVGSHAYAVHDMTAAQYRTEHGLKWTQPLTSLALSRSRSEAAKTRVGTAGWRRLEAARDPQAAADSRTPDVFSAPAARASRAEHSMDGRLPVRAQRDRVCPICGTTFRHRQNALCSPECLRVQRARLLEGQRRPAVSAEDADRLRATTDSYALAALVRDLQGRGFSSASIGRALGRSGAWMTAHFPL